MVLLRSSGNGSCNIGVQRVIDVVDGRWEGNLGSDGTCSGRGGGRGRDSRLGGFTDQA